MSEGVPQFICTACSNCHSLMGISMSTIQNRGCCSYFPKFELHDIHMLAKAAEGLEILDQIIAMPDIVIYNYYIHVKGYLDKAGCDQFKKSNLVSCYDVDDKSIFFRTCPFVKPGMGCTLPVKFRHFICNVFICREVVERAGYPELFQEYTEACSSYARWLKRENDSIEMLLRGEGLTLEGNFNDVIEYLKNLSIENYEFPELPEILISSGFSIGA